MTLSRNLTICVLLNSLGRQPQIFDKVTEFRGIKCFYEAIYWLVTSRYIGQIDGGILDVLADEIILNIDIFCSSIVLRIFSELDS